MLLFCKRRSLLHASVDSGLVLGLCLVIEDMMVTVCWTRSSLENFVKTLKFLELSASNMLAITNLAICVNLALIIMSHRTVTRVKSISSPGLFFFLLFISMGIAAATIPFCDEVVVLGTLFWCYNSDQREDKFMLTSVFFMEFVVGACMLGIVMWQLLFRMQEVKECWRIHLRIRYYFGLTLLGTVANLALGICGTIYVASDNKDSRLLGSSWMLRYVHIALDTVVLYGVLGEHSMDHHTEASQVSRGTSSGLGKC
ncbi:unnamed protein product [Hapterophycus canaliculatus]